MNKKEQALALAADLEQKAKELRAAANRIKNPNALNTIILDCLMRLGNIPELKGW